MNVKDAVKFPVRRKGVVIGKEGEVKKTIEKVTDTRIRIKDNVAEVEGKDGLSVFLAKKVIEAIGRGFNPKKALCLLNEDFSMEVINLSGLTEKGRRRVIARIIGRKGTVKKRIEKMTNTKISIYGKKVSIIGNVSDIPAAKDAIESIINGSRFSAVFKKIKGYTSR